MARSNRRIVTAKFLIKTDHTALPPAVDQAGRVRRFMFLICKYSASQIFKLRLYYSSLKRGTSDAAYFGDLTGTGSAYYGWRFSLKPYLKYEVNYLLVQ